MVKKEREDNCVREKWKRKNKNKKKWVTEDILGFCFRYTRYR